MTALKSWLSNFNVCVVLVSASADCLMPPELRFFWFSVCPASTPDALGRTSRGPGLILRSPLQVAPAWVRRAGPGAGSPAPPGPPEPLLQGRGAQSARKCVWRLLTMTFLVLHFLHSDKNGEVGQQRGHYEALKRKLERKLQELDGDLALQRQVGTREPAPSRVPALPLR